MKFEVGDKVRRIIKKHGDSGMKVGDIGTVTRVRSHLNIVIDNLNQFAFDPEYFEKVKGSDKLEENNTINFLP